MPTIDSNQLFPPIDQYWELVNRTLERLFTRRVGLARQADLLRRADDLRREINRCSPQEQLLFYHADPLDVAADLSGQRLNMENEEDRNLLDEYNSLAAAAGFRPLVGP